MLKRLNPSGRWRARPLKNLALGVAGASLLAGSATTALAKATPTITVVDPNPANWLWVTWNTMEELVHVNAKGMSEPALATGWQWKNHNKTLVFHLRHGVKFQDGSTFSAANVKQAWTRMQSLEQPHPPGKWLNQPQAAKMTVVNPYEVKIDYPHPEGNALMKFRGMHIPSKKFFAQGGWKHNGSAEGQW